MTASSLQQIFESHDRLQGTVSYPRLCVEQKGLYECNSSVQSVGATLHKELQIQGRLGQSRVVLPDVLDLYHSHLFLLFFRYYSLPLIPVMRMNRTMRTRHCRVSRRKPKTSKVPASREVGDLMTVVIAAPSPSSTSTTSPFTIFVVFFLCTPMVDETDRMMGRQSSVRVADTAVVPCTTSG